MSAFDLFVTHAFVAGQGVILGWFLWGHDAKTAQMYRREAFRLLDILESLCGHRDEEKRLN